MLHRTAQPLQLQLQLGRRTGAGSAVVAIHRPPQPRAVVPEPELGPLVRPRQDTALGVGAAVAEVVPDRVVTAHS